MTPLDTFESMLTWLEYAARTCQNNNIAWVTINGQSSVWNPTGFEDFKSYTVQKAEVEILQKVTLTGGGADYNAQIKAYLTELENEFFGRNEDGTFTDKGYYGPAAANEAMYNFYKTMRSNVAKKCDSISGYDGFKGGNSTWPMTERSFTEALGYKLGYMVNFTKEEIQGYMAYLETAMVAVQAWDTTDTAKDVAYRNVLQESFFPRFVICMGEHSDYWKNGYTTTAYNWSTKAAGKATIGLAEMRTLFKNDFAELGNTKVAEHDSMDTVYNSTFWSAVN
jgi:hypothetical protein